MKPKTIQIPLPAETAAVQQVKVIEKTPTFVSESVREAFSLLFSQTESVKCILVEINGVFNLQFIGNGCVANLQIYERQSSQNDFEAYTTHTPIHETLNPQKGGLA